MNNKLKENIKRQLSTRKMSVSELERRAGLKQSTIQNILHDRSKNPSVETIASIAQELGCSIEALMSEDKKVDPIPVEEGSPWNANLYIQAIETVQAVLHKRNRPLPKKQILACVEEIYKYSIGISEEIDQRFADWIIEKLLRNP